MSEKIIKTISKILIVTFSLLTIITLLKYSNYGLDFTDEGSYLISMQYPKLFYPNSSQFGLIYNPLFVFLSNDIQSLRAVNILFTYFLSTLLSYLTLYKTQKFNNDKFNLLVISLGVGITSLLIFKNWLITPNYNILNFHGLCIFFIGILLSKSDAYPIKINIVIFSYFLIALGGFLVFMAKISSALLLLLIYIVIISRDRSNFYKKILFPLFFVCIFYLVIFKIHNFTITEYFERLFTNIQLTKDLGAGYTLNEIFRLDFPRIGIKDYYCMGILSLTFLFLLTQENSKKTYFNLVCFILLFFFGLYFYQFYYLKTLFYFPHINFLTLIFSILFSYILFKIFNKSSCNKKVDFIWLLFVIPFIFSFGTNGNIWEIASYISLFWCLGLLCIFSNKLKHENNISFFLVVVILAFELLTSYMMCSSLNNPYRQAPNLFNYNTSIKYEADNNLLFNSSFAKYITSAIDKSESFNFNSSPLIDLSGQSPGLLFFLKAQPVGYAWLIGGYSGSNFVIKKALSKSSCSIISKSWILFEPSGPRSISPDLLLTVGIDFINDYKEVFILETPNYLGGYNYSRTQIFYRPKNIDKVYNQCILKKNQLNESHN